MFGFGGLSEVLFILFLAMLIFGPAKMPEIGRMLAKGMAEVRKASNELKRTLNAELAISEQEQEARRNAQLAAVPPPPPSWSGGQTVPNLPASGEPAAAPASETAAAGDGDANADAAYLRDWPEEGSSAPPPPTAHAPHAPADSIAPADPIAPADSAALADCAVPAASIAADPIAPADPAAPVVSLAPAASRAPAPAPALLEPYGEGSGRDPA
jgi:Sec-independent protein translocase protein TatA